MSDYHNRMVNIPQPHPEQVTLDYKMGHRDARHAAAEIAQEADAELARARETRAKELDYVIEACKAASLMRATHESRDALLDLRTWAISRKGALELPRG